MTAESMSRVTTRTMDGLALWVAGNGDERTLEIAADRPESLRGFHGETAASGDLIRLTGALSAANAAQVRRLVPHLQPQCVGRRTSAGTGDRLGLATAGHAEAFRLGGAGVMPVFAQQSVREMRRLARAPQAVVDDATFGALEAGWEGPVGADADHLRDIADIDECFDAGFVSFTIDPGNAVREIADADPAPFLDSVPWDEIEDSPAAMLSRYAEKSFDLGDEQLVVERADVVRAAAKYGRAIALTKQMHRHLMSKSTREVEVEFAVDETAEVTTPAEHLYLASELRRLEIDVVGFAPRYEGSFLKGVEYVGDRRVLEESLFTHARIARRFGPYKLSLHTGSDKFGIYPIVAAATEGLVHLKTSGTSYLAALEVIARADPDTFRDIYAVSLEAYQSASSSYPVRANSAAAPAPTDLSDEDLVGVLHDFDTRQILHVAYGAVLRTPDTEHQSALGATLRKLLTTEYASYRDAVAAHLSEHLKPFAGAVR